MNGLLCLINGGCMKIGYVHYYAVSKNANIDDELNKFVEYYGPYIRVRYIEVNESADKALDKLKKRLEENKILPLSANLYELTISTAEKELKKSSSNNLMTWSYKITNETSNDDLDDDENELQFDLDDSKYQEIETENSDEKIDVPLIEEQKKNNVTKLKPLNKTTTATATTKKVIVKKTNKVK